MGVGAKRRAVGPFLFPFSAVVYPVCEETTTPVVSVMHAFFRTFTAVKTHGNQRAAGLAAY